MSLEKAQADLQVVRLLISPLGNPNNDEELYNLAAYHAQQAVEKSIKYILHDIYGMDNSTKSFRIHNITMLLGMLYKNFPDSVISIPKDIKVMARLLTSWESSSRYSDNLVVVRKEIMQAADACEQLIKNIQAYESTIK